MKISIARVLSAAAAVTLAFPYITRAASYAEFDANSEAMGAGGQSAMDSGLVLDLQDMGQSLPGTGMTPEQLDNVTANAGIPAWLDKHGLRDNVAASTSKAAIVTQDAMLQFLQTYRPQMDQASGGKIADFLLTAKPIAGNDLGLPVLDIMVAGNADMNAVKKDVADFLAQLASTGVAVPGNDQVVYESGPSQAASVRAAEVPAASFNKAAAEKVLSANAGTANFDGSSGKIVEAETVATQALDERAQKVGLLTSQIAGIRSAYLPKIAKIGELTPRLNYYGIKPETQEFARIQGELAQIDGELKGYLDLLLTPLVASTNGGSVIEQSFSAGSSASASRGVSGTFFAHLSESKSSTESSGMSARKMSSILPPNIEKVLAVRGLTLDSVAAQMRILERRLRDNLTQAGQVAREVYEKYYRADTVSTVWTTTDTKRRWYYLWLNPVHSNTEHTNVPVTPYRVNKYPFVSGNWKTDKNSTSWVPTTGGDGDVVLDTLQAYAKQPLPPSVLK